MATRFELLLCGEDAVRLRAAGEEALREIERLEAQLSFYNPASEICWINAHAAQQAVRVEPRLFGLLQRCRELHALTAGTFDITIGPLMRAWRFVRDRGQIPSADELAAARAVTGMQHLELDEDNFSVRFDRPGVEIDLGGYGKGRAVECAMNILAENGVTNALLHGGTSSVCAMGQQPDGQPWRVALQQPFAADDEPLMIELTDRALSVSAIHGKSFSRDGKTYGHIIDPRDGQPVSQIPAAAAAGPSAADCEALSKALLVQGADALPALKDRFTGYELLICPQ